jgi:predicted transposase YbfD/YdcC
LRQLATEAKANQITAFPLLIEMLDLKGAIFTIDGAGCQKEIAKKIGEKGESIS